MDVQKGTELAASRQSNMVLTAVSEGGKDRKRVKQRT